MNKRLAFSIVEIIVCAVIMGCLVAIAIPNYITSINRAAARDVMNNLLAISSAQITYRENNPSYCLGVGNCDTMATINRNLGLNITSNGVTAPGYYCDTTLVAGTNICRAYLATGQFLDISLDNPINSINGPIYCKADFTGCGGNPVGPNPCCEGGTAAQVCNSCP